MNLIIYFVFFGLSYLFGAFAFPQIIGSARMLARGYKMPYLFAATLWSLILAVVSVLVCKFSNTYFRVYIIGLIIPLISTLMTKNIE